MTNKEKQSVSVNASGSASAIKQQYINVNLISLIHDLNEAQWAKLAPKVPNTNNIIANLEEERLVYDAKTLHLDYLYLLLYFLYGFYYQAFKQELFCCKFQKTKISLLELNLQNYNDTVFNISLKPKQYDYIKDVIIRLLNNNTYGLTFYLMQHEGFKTSKSNKVLKKEKIIADFENYMV